jgi:hypothetical protein
MNVEIWRPGTNSKLDTLFENLRNQQYNNNQDVLSKNYATEIFQKSIALSIVFDDLGNPTHCSSMMNRNCWPKKVYRVLNRMWKIDRIPVTRFVSPNICLMIKDQAEWLTNNTDCELIFVSRQYNNWRKMLIRDFNLYSNLEFKTDANKYQTCSDDVDSCWQHIIYYGNEKLLEHWNHK